MPYCPAHDQPQPCSACEGRRAEARFVELVAALEARFAPRPGTPTRVDAGRRKLLQAVVDRYGLDAAFAELPAIDSDTTPVLTLRNRLEGSHRVFDAGLQAAEMDSWMTCADGWDLMWARLPRGAEEFDATRVHSTGRREAFILSSGRHGDRLWHGQYVLEGSAGRVEERLFVWCQPSCGEAFASLNRRRLAVVGELGRANPPRAVISPRPRPQRREGAMAGDGDRDIDEGARHLLELTEARDRARNGWMPAISADAVSWALATLADLKAERDAALERAMLADQAFELGLAVLAGLRPSMTPGQPRRGDAPPPHPTAGGGPSLGPDHGVVRDD